MTKNRHGPTGRNRPVRGHSDWKDWTTERRGVSSCHVPQERRAVVEAWERPSKVQSLAKNHAMPQDTRAGGDLCSRVAKSVRYRGCDGWDDAMGRRESVIIRRNGAHAKTWELLKPSPAQKLDKARV